MINVDRLVGADMGSLISGDIHFQIRALQGECETIQAALESREKIRQQLEDHLFQVTGHELALELFSRIKSPAVYIGEDMVVHWANEAMLKKYGGNIPSECSDFRRCPRPIQGLCTECPLRRCIQKQQVFVDHTSEFRGESAPSVLIPVCNGKKGCFQLFI